MEKIYQILKGVNPAKLEVNVNEFINELVKKS
jgi:hypothetical protein